MGDFSFPFRIVEGVNFINQAGEIIKDYGKRVVLIGDSLASSETGWFPKLKAMIEDYAVGVIAYDKLDSSSTSEIANKIAEEARFARCDVVVGFGGRNVLNIAKAVAFLISHGGIIEDYFLGKKGKGKTVKYIEIPTTVGYLPGLTPDIQIIDKYDGIKKYLEAELFADLVIVDPKITTSLPDDFVRSISLETIAVSIETFLSKKNNFITETNGLKAIELVNLNLAKAIKDPENTVIRNSLCEAAILASIALSFSSPGLSYAIAMAIKSIYNINQALAMSIILPYVMEFNLTTAANKLVFITKAFGESVSDISIVEAAIKAIENFRKISIENNIPQRLSELNIENDDLVKIARISRNYEFLHHLPRPVSREDILTILTSAY